MAHPFEIIRVSAVHPGPPQGGLGDEWDSNAPWVEKGLAMMCTTSSITSFLPLFFYLVHKPLFSVLFLIIIPLTSQTIFTKVYQFSNDNHTFPKLPLSLSSKIIGCSI